MKERTGCSCGSRNRVSPPTIVLRTRPRTSRPAKGVFRLLDRNRAGSTVQRSSGSNTTSAGVAAGSKALGAGVGTWTFSSLQLQADMGILLSFIFLANMVGAIVILPALVRWLMMRNRDTLTGEPEKAEA